MNVPAAPVPSKLRRRLIWAAALFLAYTLFGFLVLPWIVRKVAIGQLGQQLGREVKIEAVRINPFALSGSIQGLLIRDPDGEPLLRWDEVYGDFQLASFFGKPWVFREVRVVGPQARLQMNADRSLNVSDLVAKFSALASNAPARPSKPIFLRVGSIHVTNALLSVADLTLRTPFRRRLGPVELKLVGLETSPDNKNPYSVQGTTESGETFSWKGHFTLDPLGSDGELTLDGLSIPKYAGLFDDLVRFEVRDGVISARAAYTASIGASNYVARATNAAFTLSSLKVAPKGGGDPVLELDRLSVEGASADAVARVAEVAAVRVEGPRLDVRRFQDGKVNVVELAAPTDGATNAPGSVLLLMQATTNLVARLLESTNLASGTIRSLEVTNGVLRWTDEVNRRPVHLVVDALAVSARDLSNLPGEQPTAAVALRWNTNGLVRLGASIRLAPPAADLTLAVSDLELRPLDPYLEPFVNLFVTGSKVGLDAAVAYRTEETGPQVTFKGDARLDDFAAVDGAAGEDLLSWRSVRVEGIDAALVPPGVAVRSVTLVEPSMRLVLETNAALNLLSVVKTPSTASPAPVTPPPVSTSRLGWRKRFGAILSEALAANTNAAGMPQLPRITVGTVVLTNARAEFVDRSITPAASLSVGEVSGIVSGLSTEELKRADVQLAGRVEGTGPFEIAGQIHPLNYAAQSSLKVRLDHMDLTPASPYAGKFAGYAIAKGQLGVELDYTIRDGALKAENRIVVDQFTFGQKVESPDATRLPVRLGVAILKDRHGRITLDVPVEGRLDDPGFRFGRVIWSTLGNLFTKAVTSPFSMLGSLFGGGGEEVGFQNFAPGSAALLASESAKLEGLLKGLYERPGLQLEIEGAFDPAVDGPALRRAKLEQRFRQEKRMETGAAASVEITLTPEEFTERLNAAYIAWQQAKAATAAPTNVVAGSVAPKALGSRPGAFEKGATVLMQSTARVVPDVPPSEVEQALLATVPIAEEDFARLAAQRARALRDAVLASGKVEPERVFLMDAAAGGATNRAAKGFFHLR